ncbi:acetylornithine deacetylase [Bacillus halotolerans]|uniref:acetylornithine deacetylase n=1 Tax=Bacillus halotolerans TaxID=260554 RepID=UPI00192B489C|nr:acetylornithine deacetylase [Bacillus halotolerans]MBL4968426.1 acetylornithine deacetylase [Bacillus halotolerans]MBL4972487.1 acetylornithine deacetylase [Bacillus halotolerans]MBT9250589.1 acetylornithine deacetylase [Bacillus halotolerans]
MIDQVESLLKKAEEQKDELIELAKTLISFKTPAPPSRNTDSIQTWIAQFLLERGFSIDKWDVYPGDPNVVGVLKGTNSAAYQSLIINGHVDVAEVKEGEDWVHDPFCPSEKNGFLIGRGASDMKGGMACVLFALKLIREAGVELPGDLILQSVIGEEVGEAGTLECCKKGYHADFAVVADTSDMHIQGQGGVITGWIEMKSSQTFHDGTRRNMIHAGGGTFGASAIEKMAKIISGLGELERHWAIMKSYPGFTPGTNTINPAVIEGGRHAAFIADECRLWITVHFYPNETHEEVAAEIEDYINRLSDSDIWLRENRPVFKWGGSSMIEERGEIFPALEVDPAHPGVLALTASHEEIKQERPIIDVSQTVTDGGWLYNAGIPSVIYGPGDLYNAHAVNEEVSIKQLVDYTKIMLTFIMRWCSRKKEQ